LYASIIQLSVGLSTALQPNSEKN